MQARAGNFAAGLLLTRAAILGAVFFGCLWQGATATLARPLPAEPPALASVYPEPGPPVEPGTGQQAPPTATATVTASPTAAATDDRPTPGNNALTPAASTLTPTQIFSPTQSPAELPTVTATPTPSPATTVAVMAAATVMRPTATVAPPVIVALAPLLAIPTPTAPAPAPTDVPGADDPHVDYGATTASCAGCHRAHTGPGLALRRDWPEESTCFGCHAAAGPGTNVEPAFTSTTNTDTAYFKHDVALTNGVHRVGQSAGSDFGGSSRHIECEDCHEPHEASRGLTVAPMLPREMTAVAGVDPVWVDAGAPAAYNWLPQAEREYQVCFKCHASFTALPTYLPDGWDGDSYVADGLSKLTSADPLQIPDSRDLAREFNPHNASFHPVAAPGRNQSIPPESFVTGWSQSSLVYCSDCHANPDGAAQGDGPHGSARLHLLAGTANYTTVYGSNNRMSDQELCFNCHNYETYVTGQNNYTNFYAHSSHLNRNWGVTCYTCHDSHGSEQLHLLNLDSAAMTFLNGANSQSAWYVDSTGQAGCYLICHNRQHDNLTYWTNAVTSTVGYEREITQTPQRLTETYLPIVLK